MAFLGLSAGAIAGWSLLVGLVVGAAAMALVVAMADLFDLKRKRRPE